MFNGTLISNGIRSSSGTPMFAGIQINNGIQISGTTIGSGINTTTSPESGMAAAIPINGIQIISAGMITIKTTILVSIATILASIATILASRADAMTLSAR